MTEAAETPVADVVYPVKVSYCGECTLPLEYCEYAGMPEKCRKWLETHLPEFLEAGASVKDEGETTEKKHQKRGGKGTSKTEKVEKKAQRVSVQRAPRGKTKSVTVVRDIDLKVAAKFFSGRFACGSSVTGVDEVVIQGDVKDELFDIIPEKWPAIHEDSIDDLGDVKR